MPAFEEHSLLRFRGWTQGLNADHNEILLTAAEVPVCLNVNFDEAGSIVKRKGYSKFSTSDPAAMSWGRNIFHYRKLGGSDFLMYVDVDDELYFEDITTGTTLARAPTDLSMGTESVSAVSFDDVFYITSRGTNQAVHSYNGTAWSTITDNTLDGDGSEFPRARKLVNLHERVFAFNVQNSLGTFQSRVHWSEAGEAQDWEAASWIDFDPDDGSVIRDAVPLAEKIVVFKDKSFFVLSGVDPLSFTVFPVADQQGSLAQRSAVSTQGLLIWFDPNTGVWAFDGATYKNVDSRMNKRILDGLDTVDYIANPHAANAFYHDGKYYLSLAWTEGGGGSNAFATHMFVWDIRNDRWTEYSFGIQDAVIVNDVIYIVGPSSGSTPATGIFKLFDGETDNGTTVQSSFETPWFAPQDGFIQNHRLKKLQVYLNGNSVNPALMQIDLFTDWDDDNVTATKTLSADTTNYISTAELSGWDAVHRAFKLKISDDSDDLPWQINGIDCLFHSRPLGRGDVDG